MIESNKPGDPTADKPVMLALESLNERPGELSSLEVDMANNRFSVECLECGKKFKTSSTLPVCPRCGSVDIELAGATTIYASGEPDYGGAFDGFTVYSDAEGGL